MLLEAIYHKPYSEYAFPVDENTLVIRIRTKKDDLNNVLVVFHEKYDTTLKGTVRMEKVAVDAMFDYYEAKLCHNIKRFKYMFYLESTYKHMWFTANGFSNERPEWGFFSFSNICRGDIINIPGWFKEAIVYQIFPDRFYNPKYSPESPEYRRWARGKVNKLSHFEGSLKGIIEKIGYIKEIGINTLYLNPVFMAGSYHRYDTIDYYKIDSLLGTNEEFIKLVEICHENSIKVILDAVFNHCSSKFFAFRNLMELGEKSIYKEWFHVYSFPLKTKPAPNFECFGFFGGMPKFNTTNENVQKYFQEVAAYWIDNYNIDGFRFDAADEVDRNFWRLLRNTIKGKKKDAILIGEIWDEGYSWMGGDQFDSVLNYPSKSFINDLIAYRSISVEQFKQRVNSYLINFNSNVINTLVNIIGTHDTPRFLTLCENNKKRFELGIVLQFTLPGIPLIYYGDEIGMNGGGDPECRQPMMWKEKAQDKSITAIYKFLIDLRKCNNVLINGRYTDIKVTECRYILSYGRLTENEGIIIIMNTSDKNSRGTLQLDEFMRNANKLVSLRNGKIYRIDSHSAKITLNSYEWDIYMVEINGKFV